MQCDDNSRVKVVVICDGRVAQHGLSVLALADSGASVCVISDSFAASHRLLVVPVTPKLLRTACGRTINVSGMVYLSFLVESRMYRARFLVVPELVDSIILGRDFLRHNSLVLCVGGGRTCCSNELHGLTLGPLASFNPHPGLGTPPPHGDVKVSDFFGGCSFHGSLGCCGGGVCSFSGGSSEQMVGAIRPPLAYPVAEWVCPVDTSSNPPPVSTDPLSLLDIPQASCPDSPGPFSHCGWSLGPSSGRAPQVVGVSAPVGGP